MTVAMAMAGLDDCLGTFCLISLEVKGFRRSCWYPRLGNSVADPGFEKGGSKKQYKDVAQCALAHCN